MNGVPACLPYSPPTLTGVLVNPYAVYVTDQANFRVEKFTMGGVFALKFGSSGTTSGKFKSSGAPQGIATDSNGNIWVADGAGNRIQEFNSSGTYIGQLGCSGTSACSSTSVNGSFSAPTGIAFDASGNLWVTDYGNQRVQKFNSSGVYQSQLGCASGMCSTGSGSGSFNNPVAVAIDPSGNIWVADEGNYRVEKFNSSGVYQSQLGCASGGCSSSTANGKFGGAIWGVAADASGNIYVPDNTNNRVEKFNSSGTYVSQIGSCSSGACSSSTANGAFNGPDTITIDPSGNIWVSDDGNNRVEEFNSSGTYVNAMGSSYNGAAGSVGAAGSGNGQFNGPNFIAVGR
jgi:sugar lactone lactonase YvrE